jgi:hypothetical protein
MSTEPAADPALITKDNARSYFRATFDVNTPNATFRLVEANLVLRILHLASWVFWSLQGLIPDPSRFHIRLDGVRVGRTRRIARAYRCDVSTRLDWRVAVTIPLALETILNRRDHDRWSLDRRYLKAVRGHDVRAQTDAVKTNPVDVAPRH